MGGGARTCMCVHAQWQCHQVIRLCAPYIKLHAILQSCTRHSQLDAHAHSPAQALLKLPNECKSAQGGSPPVCMAHARLAAVRHT